MLTSSGREPAAHREQKVQEIALIDVLTSFIRMLRRQWRVIMITIPLVSALGVAYVFLTPPSYTAKALMFTDSKRLQLLQPLSQSFGDSPFDPTSVESQVEILKSENVLLPVIKNLRLTENLAFRPSGLLSSFFGSSEPRSELALTRGVLQALQDSLTVTRIGRTQVVEISFKSHDPDLSAQLVNAVADSFLLDQFEARSQAARHASLWLQDRISELGKQASAAERAVVEFKRKNNIVDTCGIQKGTEGTRTCVLMGEQLLAEINSKLVAARAETSEARAKLSRIESILGSNPLNVAVDATVADTMKSEVVTKLRTHYLELANLEADYSARYGRNHAAVTHIRDQMGQIRNSIRDELKRLAETYKSDFEIATNKEGEIQKELALAVANSQANNQAEITLRELESSANSYRVLYDNFLQRNAEQLQQQSMRISDARLISPASPPLKPSGPKTTFALAIASIGGIVLGLLLALLRDMSDRAFRTGEQVEKLLLTSCLALVPKLEIGGASHSPGEEAGDARLGKGGGDTVSSEEAVEAKAVRKVTSNRRGLATAVIDAPFSRFAEAIQSIKLAADLSSLRKSSKVIGLISALPDEGKSTIAANLARLIARTGASTALVDCDLRISKLTSIFAPDAEAGMREVIGGTASLEETMWKDELTEMRFLPAGAGPYLVHPNEVLTSEATAKLFERLRELYEWVIVDLPPIGPVMDARSTTDLVDSYIFVIEWGRTNYSTVARALDSARHLNDRLLGAILNKVEIDQLCNYDNKYIDHSDRYYTTKESEPAPQNRTVA